MSNVTVVIPTFNRAQSLGVAIESVLEQSLQPKEIIVVDDGSTDDTHSVLACFDGKIRVIRQNNTGASAARNVGIEASNSFYVAFLDSDDSWLPQKLEIQMRHLAKHPSAVASVTDLLLQDHNGKQTSVFGYRGKGMAMAPRGFVDDAFPFAFGGWFCTPTWLIRRDLLLKCGGFREGLQIFEDLELICRVAACGGFSVVPEVLVKTGWGLGATNLREIAERDCRQTRQALVQVYERLLQDPLLSRKQKSLVEKSLAGLMLRIAAELRRAGDAQATSMASSVWRRHPSPINAMRMLAITFGSNAMMRAMGLK